MKKLQQSQNMVVLTPYKEQQTIQAIMEAFPEETMYTQYMIGPYRVDLYIKGKLVVECDENNHQYRSKAYEIERQSYISDMLKCQFFRFNPDDPDFSVYRLIKDITYKVSRGFEYRQELVKCKDESIKALNRECEGLREEMFAYQRRELEFKKREEEFKEREMEFKERKVEFKEREVEYKTEIERRRQRSGEHKKELTQMMERLSISHKEHKRCQDVLCEIALLTPAQREELASLFAETRKKMDPFLTE
jgi:hypothetical protein